MIEISCNFNINFIIFLLFYVSKGEYRIKEGHVPVYLNYTFVNLEEDIFPRNINIYFSLSKIAGTLLYSVDNKNNQIIISLNDADSPTLDVEINTRHIYISLIKICGCIRCRFEKISLRVQMKDVMYLSCNNEKIESYQFVRSNKMNKDYPIPKFQKSDKLQAYLWLVNTPEMDGNYPNSAQLSGCIFEVTYNKQPLKMGKYGAGDKCPITCTNNICNSGQCLETYNNYPVCNCTDSFMNGGFCNKILKGQFCNMTQMLQFKAIKVSFQNVSRNIFELSKTELNLKLGVEERKLIFTIDFSSSTFQSTLVKEFNDQEEHIVMVIFNTGSIIVKYHRKSSPWRDVSIPFFTDLSRIIFERVTLNGSGGLIDFRYKNDIKEITWYTPFNPDACSTYNATASAIRNIDDKKIRQLSFTKDDNDTLLITLQNLNRKVEYIRVVVIGLMCLIIFIIILIIILIIRPIIIIKRRKKINHYHDENIFPINKVTKSFIENDQNLVDTNDETLIMMENNEETVLKMEADQTSVDTNEVMVFKKENMRPGRK